MNGSGKQSFYEIQLNNGSLIAAFLVAVALGVGVFMLGVMVGRGQAQQAAADAGWVEEPVTAQDGETAGDDAIEPEFFEKVQEPDQDTATTPAGGEEQGAPADESVADEAAGDDSTAGTAPVATRSQPEDLPAADPSLPPGSGWVVQVKATPQRSEAAELQATLAAAGFDAFIEEDDSSGTLMYRVRVGRYQAEADARRVESVLASRPDVSGTWVTRG